MMIMMIMIMMMMMMTMGMMVALVLVTALGAWRPVFMVVMVKRIAVKLAV